MFFFFFVISFISKKNVWILSQNMVHNISNKNRNQPLHTALTTAHNCWPCLTCCYTVICVRWALAYRWSRTLPLLFCLSLNRCWELAICIRNKQEWYIMNEFTTKCEKRSEWITTEKIGRWVCIPSKETRSQLIGHKTFAVSSSLELRICFFPFNCYTATWQSLLSMVAVRGLFRVCVCATYRMPAFHWKVPGWKNTWKESKWQRQQGRTYFFFHL